MRLSEQRQVAVDECVAPECGDESASREKAAEGKPRRRAAFAPEDEPDAVEAGQEDSDEEREDGWCKAKEGSDHGDEFDVAESHALAVTDSFVEPTDDQENERGSDDGRDASEDEILGTGEEDVAVIGDASGACEVKAVFGKEDLVFGGAEEDGLGADDEEANGDAGQGEGVGEGEGLSVDDG